MNATLTRQHSHVFLRSQAVCLFVILGRELPHHRGLYRSIFKGEALRIAGGAEPALRLLPLRIGRCSLSHLAGVEKGRRAGRGGL